MNLEGRKAMCAHCGKTTQSKEDLPFFKYKGKGSKEGELACKKCGYYKGAHEGENAKHIKCSGFEAAGEFKYDEYYDGCFGWD